MTPRSARCKYWLALGLLAALLAMLAAGWRLGHRARSEELRALESRIEVLSKQDSAERLRAENNDLTRLIDETYRLLYEAGFHIQFDLKTEEDGQLRLSADSAKLTEELKAKLRELNQLRDSAPPNK